MAQPAPSRLNRLLQRNIGGEKIEVADELDRLVEDLMGDGPYGSRGARKLSCRSSKGATARHLPFLQGYSFLRRCGKEARRMTLCATKSGEGREC